MGKDIKNVSELEDSFWCDKTADKMAEFMKDAGIKAPKTRKDRSKKPDNEKNVLVVGDEVTDRSYMRSKKRGKTLLINL